MDRRLLWAVSLTSMATLMLEVLLTRAVSVLYFPIGVYFVFSLALLGIGASGATLALRSGRWPVHGLQGATWAMGGFAISCLLTLLWLNNAQLHVLSFIGLSLGLALPFFFSGFAIALVFSQRVAQSTRVYLADLVGAGVGAIAAVVAISVTSAEVGIGLAALIGAIAAAVFGFERSTAQRVLFGGGVAAILLGVFALRGAAIVPALPPKELGLFVQRYAQLQQEYQRWGPVARIDVVSLRDDQIALPQTFDYKFVTQDGGAPSIILNLGDVRAADFTEHTILGLPYWIKSQPEVLIIGLGGGPDVQAALHYDARRILGVEINDGMIDIVRNVFSDFAGRPYDDARVQIELGDGRHVVKSIDEQFDIVQLTGVDTAVASFGASPNLAENYLYTIEAVQDYWSHLKADGLLSISFPNVEGLGARLFGLVITALEQAGERDLDQQIIVSHTGGFVHVLAKRVPFTTQEVATIAAHFDEPMLGIYYPLFDRLLDLIDPALYAENAVMFAPGLDAPSVYRERYEARQAGREVEWLAAQSLDLSAPTDDRPFFFIRDRWFGVMPNFTLLLILTTLLLFFALIFILLPLLVLRRRGAQGPGSARLAIYFACLGLGYIFVEVFLIQKLTLFLGHPAFSIPTVLGGLLIASGLGSHWSGRRAWPAATKVRRAVAAIVVLLVLHMFVVQPLLLELLNLSLALRVLIAVAVIAPAGFAMGIPFPTVLRTLDTRAPGFVAWAWGINGTASVLASVLALLIAVTAGYLALATVSALLYVAALLVVRAAIREPV